jgi:23S rRNA (cytidine1920-2'-O)/16S rRNA (cytidine1409-2'-O)-methyltransferase
MGNKRGSRAALVNILVQRGLCADVQSAAKELLAGRVYVDDQLVDKAGAIVREDAVIRIAPRKTHVSRAAQKLKAALNSFPIAVPGKICADVGACTGGFTEVLLQSGASKVYAIDVGYGDLDWKIRSDPKVVVMERTNARYLETVGEPVSLVSIDVSFISLDKILPAVVKWLEPSADIIALIKPQFEAQRDEVEPGGVITNPKTHEQVVERVKQLLPSLGLIFKGLQESPILGAEGNKEFLLWAARADLMKAQ